jgi:hypothetical protein
MALPLRNLAIIASRRGQYDVARRLLEESLLGLRDLGEKWCLSRSIETLAKVLAAAGDHERSARLLILDSRFLILDLGIPIGNQES